VGGTAYLTADWESKLPFLAHELALAFQVLASISKTPKQVRIRLKIAQLSLSRDGWIKMEQNNPFPKLHILHHQFYLFFPTIPHLFSSNHYFPTCRFSNINFILQLTITTTCAFPVRAFPRS